jgi:hypothetical protein
VPQAPAARPAWHAPPSQPPQRPGRQSASHTARGWLHPAGRGSSGTTLPTAPPDPTRRPLTAGPRLPASLPTPRPLPGSPAHGPRPPRLLAGRAARIPARPATAAAPALHAQLCRNLFTLPRQWLVPLSSPRPAHPPLPSHAPSDRTLTSARHLDAAHAGLALPACYSLRARRSRRRARHGRAPGRPARRGGGGARSAARPRLARSRPGRAQAGLLLGLGRGLAADLRVDAGLAGLELLKRLRGRRRRGVEEAVAARVERAGARACRARAGRCSWPRLAPRCGLLPSGTQPAPACKPCEGSERRGSTGQLCRRVTGPRQRRQQPPGPAQPSAAHRRRARPLRLPAAAARPRRPGRRPGSAP